MEIKPLAVGAILFGALAIGGAIDGARRKIIAQPDWVAMNWKTVVRGTIGWIVLGAVFVLGGIVALFV